MEKAISKFWQLDQVIHQPTFTAEKREYEEHFKETHYRNIQRFVVEMLFKQDATQSLDNSYDIRTFLFARAQTEQEPIKGTVHTIHQ